MRNRSGINCFLFFTSSLFFVGVFAEHKCPKLTRASCCVAPPDDGCFPRSCFKWINRYCPSRASLFLQPRSPSTSTTTQAPGESSERALADLSDIRRAQPARNNDLGKCGTAERHYLPCTTREIADKLFHACCSLYVPVECHSLCTYETDQGTARQKLTDVVRGGKCSLKFLSSILFCASQNRDNRKCCAALDLNSPQLQVGSRCLRMCDPSGTSIEKITKDDVTCLYNWNVMMYCHHAGIREM